jgi:hypothetical protein
MGVRKTVVTKEDVEAFTGICVSLRSIWQHYWILFEGAKLNRELLADVAPIFFSDICALLREHLVLHICRITDREEMSGRENLTVAFLVSHSNFPSGTLEKLQRLSDGIHGFRKIILPARNRFISHLDLEAIRAGDLLGSVEPEKWNQFWLDLQDFVHIVHKHYVDASGHFYLNGIAMASDADSLVQALRESRYFRDAMDDKQVGKRVTEIGFKSRFYDAA